MKNEASNSSSNTNIPGYPPKKRGRPSKKELKQREKALKEHIKQQKQQSKINDLALD